MVSEDLKFLNDTTVIGFDVIVINESKVVKDTLHVNYSW